MDALKAVGGLRDKHRTNLNSFTPSGTPRTVFPPLSLPRGGGWESGARREGAKEGILAPCVCYIYLFEGRRFRSWNMNQHCEFQGEDLIIAKCNVSEYGIQQ